MRELSIRGDIIKTMHRAMTAAGREPDVSGFALHGDDPPIVLGRLVGRGLHDELKGTAYAIVEGVDGRTHHLQFSDLEMTGDAKPGAIVEARSYEDAKGRSGCRSPRGRTSHRGAGDRIRRDLDRPAASRARGDDQRRRVRCRGARCDGSARRALVEEGLARRQGQRVIFARDLLDTLRRREIDVVAAKISARTELIHRPSGEGVTSPASIASV